MANVIMLKAVTTYQCPGCMHGPDASSCESAKITEKGCSAHAPGTRLLGVGAIALGLPKGFTRYGAQPLQAIEVYEAYPRMVELYPNLLTKFSLPIWKHLDEHGNTIVRWFSPRTNAGWSNVILGDCRDSLPFAMEITAEDLDNMD